ncbi:MAG: NfeD family protein [Acidobacteria bacterium]|nr:NfeD family protein [Acidobacteriota bacterium]
MPRAHDRTFLRYLLLQVPGWVLLAALLFVLRTELGLSGWLAAVILIAWTAKDLVLYRFVRSAYEEGPASAAEHLVGGHGVVTEPLTPRGYIRVRGELWRAEMRSAREMPVGSTVRIVSARGLTLHVDPPE